MPKHDCVAAMLAVYRGKEKELDDLSTEVDELTIDINKQTTILARLNHINTEKTRRIANIERCLNTKHAAQQQGSQIEQAYFPPQNNLGPNEYGKLNHPGTAKGLFR
jgi:hypothetical protein